MPGNRKIHESLMKSWISKLPENQRRHFKVEGGKIFCRPCGNLYDWNKASQLPQHVDSGKHIRLAKLDEESGQHQTVVTEVRRSEFNQDLCKALLAADIPLNKLKNPVLRNFLEKYCKKAIPEESTLRKNYIPDIHEEVLNKIRSELENTKIFIQADETTDKTGRFVANIIVGALRKDSPPKPHLLMARQLETTDNVSVTQLVVDSLNLLWPKMEQAEIAKRFLVFLTDGAAYMIKAGKNLNNLYPNLIHVTCIAHGLHRVAECIRSTFKNVDQLVANIKAIFKKSPSRIRIYKQLFPDLPLPPEAVLTRWGTWLDAVEFIAINYNAIKTVVLSFDEDEAECVRKAQKVFQNEKVTGSLAELSANFTFISKTITKLEARNLSLADSLALLEGVRERLVACVSINRDKVLAKYEGVVKKNPGLQKMTIISNILSGNDTTSKTGLDPDTLAVLTFCPLTSVEVERSFSMAKSLLNTNRLKFTMKNYEKCLVCHYELGNMEQ